MPFDLNNVQDGHDYHSFPSVVLVLLYTFLGVATFAIVIPTSDAYTSSLGSQPWFGGLAIGATVFAGALASPLWKKLCDHVSMDFAFKLSAVIQAFGSVIYACAGYANSLPLLLIGRVIQGAGSSQNVRLSYLGCAVSTRKLTGIFAIEAAMQAYAYAGGPLLAFFISLFTGLNPELNVNDPSTDKTSAYYLLCNENADAGWCMAAAWIVFFILQSVFFVEPDQTAGFKSNSNARSNADDPTSASVPSFWSLRWSAIFALMLSMFVMPLVFGAFEVLTISVAQSAPFNLDLRYAALYLAGVMFFCATLTVGFKPLLSRWKNRAFAQDRNIVLGMFAVGAVLIALVYIVILERVYEGYITDDSNWPVFVLYLLFVGLACTALNIARAGTVALLAKPILCPPEWRSRMMMVTSFTYLFGRGAGPLIASAVAHWVIVLVMTIGCLLVAVVVGLLYRQLGTLDISPEEGLEAGSQSESHTARSSCASNIRDSQVF